MVIFISCNSSYFSIRGQGPKVRVDGVGGHGRVQRLIHRVPQHDGKPAVGQHDDQPAVGQHDGKPAVGQHDDQPAVG